MHTDIRQLLELIPIVPNEQIKTCCSMMDHLDREVIFKNEFVAFMVELNEAFKNVYIENPDGTLILLIQIQSYKSNEGFRLANLFFYVKGLVVKGIEIDSNIRHLQLDFDNNWTEMELFAEKISWFINAMQDSVKIL